MLLLAEAAIPGRFEVATVDHGLRPESIAECAFVESICRERGVPCAVLSVSVDDDGNLQANARKARYEALRDWAEGRRLSAVATAHHEDDQAETLVMRLNRGSGVAGLAGVRERTRLLGSDVVLVRPMLMFSRWALERIVQASGIKPIRDPSNEDQRFDRVRIRTAMADRSLLDPAAIAWSARALAAADEALEWAEQLEWDERVTATEAEVRYRPRAPQYIARCIAEHAIASFGRAPRGQDVARLLESLEAGKGGNVAGVLATVEGDEWVYRREPPRRTG
jgi:tRNA(Ile)-lysidine synthase